MREHPHDLDAKDECRMPNIRVRGPLYGFPLGLALRTIRQGVDAQRAPAPVAYRDRLWSDIPQTHNKLPEDRWHPARLWRDIPPRVTIVVRECDQCGCPSSTGKCSVQPWHCFDNSKPPSCFWCHQPLTECKDHMDGHNA